LRQIAGLDQPDSGRIMLGDTVMFSADAGIFLPPQKRNMGMVFQSYAIWPHLSVFENVAYPLRLRRLAAAQVEQATSRVITQVGLGGMEHRSATTLSGGQQQRVALARALVYQPEVLLLDEPFSNLDVKLREQMRIELKLLQRQVGVTVILVTHDQSEALSLADRIAVMNLGRIEQVGSCTELYEKPASAFVRDFIGQTNRIPVTISGPARDGEVGISVNGGHAALVSARSMLGGDTAPGRHVIACIRPENVVVGNFTAGAGENSFEATIEALLFAGDCYECVVDFAGIKILAFAPRSEPLAEGQSVRLKLPKEAVTLWPS
jgi:ABC-type Fe3+/spermidine/putrescine transport system ATPase subunit